jgi:hypothetical protein
MATSRPGLVCNAGSSLLLVIVHLAGYSLNRMLPRATLNIGVLLAQVHQGLAHAEDVCADDCHMDHRFCTVQLLVPAPVAKKKTGHRVAPGGTRQRASLCVDLHPRLQLASFQAMLFCESAGVRLQVSPSCSGHTSLMFLPPENLLSIALQLHPALARAHVSMRADACDGVVRVGALVCSDDSA